MNTKQFIKEIHVENNRSPQMTDYTTETEFLSFFKNFRHFLSHLKLDAHTWIVTNLNNQRFQNQNYYMLKLGKTKLHLHHYLPTKHWEFKYTIESNQLHFNQTIARDSAPYQLFSKLLRQIESDIMTGQGFVFQKGD
tara:strand:- start:485 stop:895 length:411 start_codon:yes stop_codon:yes gene_type:complete